MNTAVMILCCFAAGIPLVMVIANLRLYNKLSEPLKRDVLSVSVLIPARNEAINIRAAIESVLHCDGLDFEVLVWDDGSTDETASIVRELSRMDPRVRLIEGSMPPEGWAGKPFGCWSLAKIAKGDVLVFMDADVRLRAGDSLVRMSAAFLNSELDLLSGIPRQKVETLSEVMLVPLIHFILLGFLPIQKMRSATDPRFAAACGQLMLFRKTAYFDVGGHGAARGSFHEGIALSRAFRKAGRQTDLFDATDVAVCRMYSGIGEVWRGFAKNAHEGLAAPKSILPFSALLFMGHVLPFSCLVSNSLNSEGARWAFFAMILSFAARGVLAVRYKQPFAGVILQPIAVGFLLINQWYGAMRYWIGKPVAWRGRSLAKLGVFLLSSMCSLAYASTRCPEFELEDQSGVSHRVGFPRQRPLYIVAANRQGTGRISGWVKPVAETFGNQVEIYGLADVRGIPSVFHGAIRLMIREGTRWPVLLDWKGDILPKLCDGSSSSEVFVVHPKGDIRLRLRGEASSSDLEKVNETLRSLIK
jgi:hypothetical protein